MPARSAGSTPQPRQARDAGWEYTLGQCSSQTPPLLRPHPQVTHKHLILRSHPKTSSAGSTVGIVQVTRMKTKRRIKWKKYRGRKSHMASFFWFYLKVCGELLHQRQMLDNTKAWSLTLTSITGTVWPNHMLTQAACKTREKEWFTLICCAVKSRLIVMST